ncbi:hypothetical protein [Nocardia sp. NPDC127526]|uniref:hypothetical protein n=1 Tax=Nocardia sp. NPDC127526 TaxID=3345393 RepID=UPI00362EF936
MRIKRFTATAVLAIGAVFLTVGVAGADSDGLPVTDPSGVAIQENTAPPGADPVDAAEQELITRQCNALIGALVGGVIGGTGSALPGALIGAAIGAAVGYTMTYPPGPPLGCWQVPQ